MRRIVALILLAGLLLASCGDDDAATTSSSTPEESSTTAATTTTEETTTTAEATTTSEETTTTTAPPPGSYAVEEIDTCVIGSSPGGEVNVRSGAGSGFELVGTLAEDATGVHTTGWALEDTHGDEWRQIVFDGGHGWVFSDYLTPGECMVGPPVDYCTNEAACTDVPNVRTGLGVGYPVVTTLPRNASGIAGTGATALDTLDRTWIQVHHSGKVGWVAGWLLEAAPCSPTSCFPPTLPWLITTGAVGPIEVGMTIGNLDYLTGFHWTWQEPAAEGCLVGDAAGVGVGLQADDGVVVDHIAVGDTGSARTAKNIRVGSTRAQLNIEYAGHITHVGSDGYGGVAVWVDLGSDASADMIAIFDGPGPLEPVRLIRVPAILIEGGCT